MNINDLHRDRARGALVGAALGDALGAPFEGMARVPADALERWLSDPRDLRYTDDTHMTIGIAQSLIAAGGFDGAHMAATFARNYAREPWRGYGAGPPRVFRLIEQGTPWDQAARGMFGGAGSFGNGAAMRVAPAALFMAPDLEAVRELAGLTAIITHTHELGVEGAVLQALAVAMLLNSAPAPVEPEHLLRSLQQRARAAPFPQKLQAIESLLGEADARRAAEVLGTGIAAQEAVPAALYSFLKSPRSFSDAVGLAISLGGDTDTIACMTGALSGAYLGEEALPVRWRERLEGAEEIRQLADRLVEGAAC